MAVRHQHDNHRVNSTLGNLPPILRKDEDMNKETAIQQADTFSNMEAVVIGGDLSKLSAEQRVQYYQSVCKSIGINPLTRPFNYITLNGKLTLYATKDAADQLRNLHGVSIDDVDITEDPTSITVKVKGHDKEGRADVEIGVVAKGDMQGNLANVKMKAVTKAKRRLTLSLCGLGWLDETEVETIPDAKPVTVTDTGKIVDNAAMDKARMEWSKLVVRANNVKVAVPILKESITVDELREEYRALKSFVDDAEAQATA
jgi:hypothetical protein